MRTQRHEDAAVAGVVDLPGVPAEPDGLTFTHHVMSDTKSTRWVLRREEDEGSVAE